MSRISNHSSTSSVKGKVLLAFLLTTLALGTSWIISKLAFENMLTKLEVLSTPNDKLRLVNKVFKNIIQLDHLQNTYTLADEDKKEQFLIQSKELAATLDTLSLLSIDDPMQIVRIDSMRHILAAREKIFANYIKVKSKLVSNQDLSKEVKNISGLITTKKSKRDSTVVKTEKRTTTTTTYLPQPTPVQQQSEEDKKGFFGRVFSSKKNKKAPAIETPKIVEKREVNVEVDTLKVVPKDSMIEMVGKAVFAIEKSQKKRTTSFMDREQELAMAGNTMVSHLVRVMENIEKEVVRQSNADSSQSRNMVTANIGRIEWIMLGFFILTAVLAYFIFTDITKSNKYRNELEYAKEEAEYHSMAKQRFLSNMSHEIRTPLQSIIGYTEALKKDEKPKEQDLHNLHTAAEHLLYLVNDVLDYSRIISDQFTFEERTFAIHPLLNEVVQMLRPTAKQKNLPLRLNMEVPANLLVKGDPFRLRQILYNLLTNAIKFTDEGEVSLTAKTTETDQGIQVQFKVTDTGIGLSTEQASRIFNQFEQADLSTSRLYGGTGLGLSIVKSLVEGMNGQIEVQSHLGKGTEFTIDLLLPQSEEDTLEKIIDETPKVYDIKGRVWLVDDDAFILKWCSSVLDLYHVDHDCFSAPNEVLSRPWDPAVKFVLTDMRMPGMNGAELCARLREVAAPDVQFYVLTAQALPEERSKLLGMGFDGILMKPFHSNQLLELLAKSSINKEVEKTHVDLSLLTEMTFGDEGMLREILDLFVKDSKQDLTTIEDMLATSKTDGMHELMHRMAGRTGQIGAKEVSAKFRHQEIALRDEGKKIAPEAVRELIAEAKGVIEEIEEKALSYSI